MVHPPPAQKPPLHLITPPQNHPATTIQKPPAYFLVVFSEQLSEPFVRDSKSKYSSVDPMMSRSQGKSRVQSRGVGGGRQRCLPLADMFVPSQRLLNVSQQVLSSSHLG